MKMQRIVLALVASLCAVSVQAAPIPYTTALTGAAEFPSNGSPGSGFAEVTYDPAAHSLLVEVEFADLLAPTTAAHIHCCVSPKAAVPNAGVATQVPFFVGFPIGVTSGTYSHLFDLTDPASFNPAFVTANWGTAAGAEARLAFGLSRGFAYLNVHTSEFPAGEIRGFLQAPEPATLTLLGLGFGALTVATRRRGRRW